MATIAEVPGQMKNQWKGDTPSGIRWGRAIGKGIKGAAFVGATVFAPGLAEAIGDGFASIDQDWAQGVSEAIGNVGTKTAEQTAADPEYFANTEGKGIAGFLDDVGATIVNALAWTADAAYYAVQELGNFLLGMTGSTTELTFANNDTVKDAINGFSQTLSENKEVTLGIVAGAAAGKSALKDNAQAKVANRQKAAYLQEALARGPAGHQDFQKMVSETRGGPRERG